MRRGQVEAAPAASGERKDNQMDNANLLTIKEYLKRDSRSLMDIAKAVLFGARMLRRFAITGVK